MPFFEGDCVDGDSCRLRGLAGLVREDVLEGAELSAAALIVRC